jgi:signal transduction histidine kinase
LRPAFVAVLGLALVYAAAELANNGVNTATVASVAIGGAFTILLSVLLGSYITKIIDQSLQRASLIAELERARDELGVLSREAGALAERERLAREIHDALAQGFTSVIMLAEAAQAAVDRGDLGLARRQLGLLEDAARDGLVEAR